MAINLKKQGRLDESLKYYKKALALEPKNHNFLYNVGLLYSKRNEYGKAIEKLVKSIEIAKNNNPYAYLALADAYEKKQDINLAIKTY
jgi:tetratricopeptide (TPR) repeat protein